METLLPSLKSPNDYSQSTDKIWRDKVNQELSELIAKTSFLKQLREEILALKKTLGL